MERRQRPAEFLGDVRPHDEASIFQIESERQTAQSGAHLLAAKRIGKGLSSRRVISNNQRWDCSGKIESREASPLKFFGLLFALSVPFWLFGGLTKFRLLPRLPVSSLMAFCPLMAASVLLFRENGTAAVTELLRRSFDCGRIRAKVWYAPIVLLMPGVMLLTYALMRFMNLPLPTRAVPDPRGPDAAACALYRSFG